MIAPDDALAILAVLALNVAVCEWLVRHTIARHFGTALLVIVTTAITANLGWIPTGAVAVPLYDEIFATVAPIGIFLLLLGVSLVDIARAGLPMLVLFGSGAVGTMAGVFVGMAVIGGPASLGELFAPLGGMFAGTYTGGSANFNFIAIHYGVAQEGVLYTGAVAVDSIMTAAWMVITIALPRLLRKALPGRSLRARRSVADARIELAEAGRATEDAGPSVTAVSPPAAGPAVTDGDREATHPFDIAVLVLLACGALWCSRTLDAALRVRGYDVPSALILTTIALVLAQVRAVRRLAGARVLGLTAVYLFLAVIGAYCDLSALADLGRLGATLFVFAAVLIGVHALVVFGIAGLFRMDWDVAAVASQANIGGGTSALALARSLGRADLVLPGILAGALGTALGTFAGFLMVGLLE